MINKYTLKFQNTSLEQQYLNHQNNRFIKELFNFSIYTMGYCVINLIEFIALKKYFYAGVVSAIIVLVLILYLVVRKKIQYLDYLLIFYQFLIAIIFKIDNFISGSQKVGDDFSWYFGFQCCILHYCINRASFYQQHIYKSFSVILVLIFHIHGSNIDQVSGIMNILKFSFVFVIMATVKYTITLLSKQQFLQSLSSKQIYELIQNQIDQWSMLIKLDYQQDQINMIWCNQLFQEKCNFHDDVSMRQFIRSLLIGTNGIMVESQIRELLMNDYENKQRQLKITYKGKPYQIKLLQTQNSNDLICLLLMYPIKETTINYTNVFLAGFLHRFIIQFIKQQQQLIRNQVVSQIERYYLINQGLMILQLTKNKMPQTKQYITKDDMDECLKQIFGRTYKLFFNCLNFKSNLQLIIQLIISIVSFLSKSKKIKSKLHFYMNQLSSDKIQITMIFEIINEYIVQDLILLNSVKIKRIRSLKDALTELMYLQLNRKLTVPVAFNLISISRILQSISLNTHLFAILIDEQVQIKIDILNDQLFK